MPGPTLDSREFKLLLDAGQFRGSPSAGMANALWQDKIIPVLDACLGPGRNDKQRGRGKFELAAERTLRFWDLEDGPLARHLLSLRERAGIDGTRDGKLAPELSLKLRTPDLFIAASTELPGREADARTKLEEDIAPLAIKCSGPGAQAHVCLPAPRSTRSRFSLSTRQSVRPPRTFGQLLALYPTLADVLAAARAEPPAKSSKLVSGPEVHEVLFEGAQIALGQSTSAELAFSLWYFGAERKTPGAVEISWKCKLTGGAMPAAAARAAFALFVALQTELAKLLEMRETSKTVLALPKRVGAP